MSRFIYNVYVYRSCILILHENNQSIGFITHIWVCLQKESCCISSVRVCLKWQSDMLSPLPLPVQCAAVAGLQGAGPDRSGMQCGFLSVIRAYKNTHTLMSPSVPAACITGNRVSLKRMADYSESRPTDLMVLEQIYIPGCRLDHSKWLHLHHALTCLISQDFHMLWFRCGHSVPFFFSFLFFWGGTSGSPGLEPLLRENMAKEKETIVNNIFI